VYSDLFNNGCDFAKVNNNFKKPIKCYVKESFPHFLVSDGFFFVPAYFTSDAIKQFKAKFGNVLVTDLKEKVIVLNNWHLEMKRVNSSEVFTSYANLEARLIVTSFKPQLNEKIEQTRYPTNLFRDDEIKTTIQSFRHDSIQKSLSKSSKGESLPDISKLGDAKKSKADASSVVALKGDKGEFSDYSFKEGTT